MRFASSTRPAVLMSLSLALGVAGVWSCGSDGETTAGPPPGGGGAKNDASVDASGGTAGTAGSGGSAGAAASAGSKDSGPDAPSGQTQCGVCTTDANCATGYKCIKSPLGDSFCAFDCASAACPSTDSECTDLSTWGQDGGAAGAAGSGPDPDAAVDDDAGDTDAAATGGSGGGGQSEGKFCVPKGELGCPCTAAREGVQRSCFNTNEHGTCVGAETCKSGSWQGCDAEKPQKEICDTKDNNCNGFIDMDEPGITGNQLCAGGMAPPHSGFSCVLGACELSGCEPGWTKYPPSTPQTDGCNCPIDPPDTTVKKNDACADSVDQGAIVDVGSQPKVIQGTLSTDTDADWYAIVATDQKEPAAPNSFWVHVEFQADGNPADEYRFELIRSTAGGDACDATKAKGELLTYDWCAKNGASPETYAGDDASSTYRLKVYRKAGAAGTCKPYKLKVSNGGANPGPCPADDGCGT